MTVEQPPTDIVAALRADHAHAEDLLARFESVAPDRRHEYFCEVVHDLVGHEVAEERVVYPVARRHAPTWEAQIEARLAEQSEAEQQLARMEVLDPQSEEFAQQFHQLRHAVQAHARAEESQIFPLLAAIESDDGRLELGAMYTRAKGHAPTHPHPHVPQTPPGNQLLGPIAALFDKVRDAIQMQ